jgi:hypothetical protein
MCSALPFVMPTFQLYVPSNAAGFLELSADFSGNNSDGIPEVLPLPCRLTFLALLSCDPRSLKENKKGLYRFYKHLSFKVTYKSGRALLDANSIQSSDPSRTIAAIRYYSHRST